MDRKSTIFFGAGLLGLGAYLMLNRRQLSDLATSAVDEANDWAFRAVLPSAAEPYADVIRQVSSETGVDPFVVAAIGWRESRWGQALDANGLGDNGHGHGIMQIDDRTWSAWLASNYWLDPYTNVRKGAEIYASNLSYFERKGLVGDMLVQAALAAYNRGPGNVWASVQAGNSPDTGTAGGDYGSDVLGMASSWASAFAISSGVA